MGGGAPMCNQSESPRIIISICIVPHSFPFEQLWLQQCSWQATFPVASFARSLWSAYLEQYASQTTGDTCTVASALVLRFCMFWFKKENTEKKGHSTANLCFYPVLTIQNLMVANSVSLASLPQTPLIQHDMIWLVLNMKGSVIKFGIQQYLWFKCTALKKCFSSQLEQSKHLIPCLSIHPDLKAECHLFYQKWILFTHCTCQCYRIGSNSVSWQSTWQRWGTTGPLRYWKMIFRVVKAVQ